MIVLMVVLQFESGSPCSVGGFLNSESTQRGGSVPESVALIDSVSALEGPEGETGLDRVAEKHWMISDSRAQSISTLNMRLSKSDSPEGEGVVYAVRKSNRAC